MLNRRGVIGVAAVGAVGKGAPAKLGIPGGPGNHDTIGMLALDAAGNLAGACTTSGMAWKRQGLSPEAACKAAVARILKRKPEAREIQVGFLAINKHGEVGAWSIQKDFSYALCDQARQDQLLPGKSFY